MDTNVLYWGDNLHILRNKDYFPDQSVDLIYLDPPFNSNASYNVLFKEATGEQSSAQLQAFTDTWHWDQVAADTWADLHSTAPKRVQDALDAFQKILVLQEGRFARNDMMAYLVMMTARLIELHRILKDTGSLYLHCDSTASHYLKVILDTILGPASFRNEIVWKRTTAHNDPRRYGRNADRLLFYTKSMNYAWNALYSPHEQDYIARFRRQDPNGRRWADYDLTAKGLSGGGYEYEYKGVSSLWRVPRETMERLDSQGKLHFTSRGGIRLKRYLDENKGTLLQEIWTDVDVINSQARERTGYQTQKPLALLDRIIQASSNEGDVVLDPFCGCGTAILAAHKLNRRWIGIDVTNLAITVMRKRLDDAFPGIQYSVIGEPTTLSEAKSLAKQEPEGRYQFQWWALGLIGALPASDGRRKGADAGVDGFFSVHHDNRKFTQVIIQVKSGHVGPSLIRDLSGTIGDDKLGVFITLEEPTAAMKTAATSAGLYDNPLMNRMYPRVQILTVEDLLNGKQPNLPPRVQGAAGPRIGQVRQGALSL